MPAKSTWQHVKAGLKQAATGGDTTELQTALMLEGVEYELRQAIVSPKSNRMRELIDDHYGCCDCANEYERQSRVSRDFPLSVVHDFTYYSSQRGLPAWPRARGEADSKAGATADVPSPGAISGARDAANQRAQPNNVAIEVV